jgi:hypothetical protein
MSKATSFLILVAGIGVGFAVAAALSVASQQGTGGAVTQTEEALVEDAMTGMHDARMILPDDGRSLDQLLAALDGKRVVTSRFGAAGG